MDNRITRVRHELKRRQLQVLRVESPSPNFRRVVLGGESLADFASLGFDDHVKLFFGDAMRDYTPRWYDTARRELAIEFALHGDGPAAHWAAQAKPGDAIAAGGPRGSLVVPVDFGWHLLAGDETALPAVARRLDELPAGSRAIVVLQVAAADRRPLTTRADLSLHWVDDGAALLSALRTLALPPGDGYAWVAAEFSVAMAARGVLVDERGVSRQTIRAASYWKAGDAGHHENLAAPGVDAASR